MSNNHKFKASPKVEEAYREWLYKSNAATSWVDDHPFMEWLQDNYPEVYKTHYEQYYSDSVDK